MSKLRLLVGLVYLSTLMPGLAISQKTPSEINDSSLARTENESSRVKGSVVDSHIHLWDLPRHGPVLPGATGDFASTTLQDNGLFPEGCCAAIAPFWMRDFLMSNYNQTPGGQKTSKVVLVEALPGIGNSGFDLDKQVVGNQWMLDIAKQNCKILSVVGLLDVTLTPSVFNGAFNQLKGNRQFVGIRLRGFYVANPGQTPTDRTFSSFTPNFLENMRSMVRAGLRTFEIPEEDTHPTATVALAREFPNVNFVVNHYANFGGHHPNTFAVPQAWIDDLALLASERNIMVKVGFILKWGSPADGFWPWPAKVSQDAASYRPGLDAMLDAFGPNRLLWESNWPTSEMSGGNSPSGHGGPAGWREGAVDTIDLSLSIVESWLADKNPSVRDKIMGENALRVYSPR